MSGRLRVGIVARSTDVSAWQWALLRGIAGSDYAEVVLLILADARDREAPSAQGVGEAVRRRVLRLLDYANDRLERRASLDADALERRSAGALLAGVPTVHAHALDEQALGSYRLDVAIDLDGNAPLPALERASRYGVWSLEHGDARAGFGSPAGFWEVFRKVPVTLSGIRMSTAAGTRELACWSLSATDPVSVRRSNNAVYWKTAAMVPRTLRALQRRGMDALRSSSAELPPARGSHGRPEGPRVAQLAAHVATTAVRGLRNKLQSRFSVPQWILLFRFAEGLSTDMARFQEIIPPKDRFWADPHVLYRDDRHYVFFEEYLFDSGKGHISVLALDGQGRYAPPVRVLERDYHLSYPFVFEHAGELYMVPESAENRTIELWRCTEFPDKWSFVRNLFEDVYAVDTTLAHHGGKWWLFTTMVEHRGASPWDELFLFHADALDGAWTPHPLNPIVSDVRRARPAGPIFSDRGRLYRPAQDCSIRYGYAIRIHHIMKLSDDDYAEAQVASVEPAWDREIVATHTLTYAHGLTVVDALRPRYL